MEYKVKIDSAKWFVDSEKWLKICFGYNNPINYNTIHSELLLINSSKSAILKHSIFDNIIFYGIGSGDTEMQVVDIVSEKYPIKNIYGVDINQEFLELFNQSIKLRAIEKSEILNFNMVNQHFDSFKRPSIINNENSMIFILGSTIGNYDNKEHFFNILERVIIPNDIVFISFQTNKHINIIFEKYRNNALYNDLISQGLDIDKEKIKWILNKNNNKIEAIHKNTQLFRSIKYNPNELIDIAQLFNYNVLDLIEDNSKNIAFLIISKCNK